MKTLANCNPKEFLVQTNKIRKSVANWLSLTKVLEIRKNMPNIPADATAEERKSALQEQAKKNLMSMLDSILEEYPEETAELLGLLCFIEPEDLQNHKMTEFFGAFAEMINCPEIIGFFTSLMQLERINISTTAKG